VIDDGYVRNLKFLNVNVNKNLNFIY